MYNIFPVLAPNDLTVRSNQVIFTVIYVRSIYGNMGKGFFYEIFRILFELLSVKVSAV